ncbi:uncharacterized protein LOC114527920 [Dendronephthya gigantea]|uniref:uncharacterized protein LOC114527920 n=1 Tax=Dendronephthya gigantea TaxID=151771 RepID=UPI00106BFB66|nr:uncharacterized protein LOC114527920 [Dendronephthya gigantea]
MKGYLAIFAVSLAVASLLLVDAAPQAEVHSRAKRGFKSYFENYLDEMATSACVAMGSTGSLYFAVRRTCTSSNTQNCHSLCTSHQVRKEAQIWNPNKLLNSKCVESLHVYKGRPSLADNKNADTDVNKVGLAIYRYHSCHSSSCGPNYCCCSGPYEG